MRQPTIESKVLIFKTLAISKVLHPILVKDVPPSVIPQLDKIQEQFIWKNQNFKLKYTVLCNEYEKEGLTNVDIFSKITIFQCSWVKRLVNSFHV